MTKKETNSGDYNSGHYNSGHYNSGDYNSGHLNSGDYNSGAHNSGDYNSGAHNSGDYNSGHYNSGHYNSGDYNSGHRNSGHYNSGHYNSGHFNTNEPTLRLFNKDTGLKRADVDIPYIYLPITEWVLEKNMTNKQKKEDPDFHIKGGTLVKRSYKEAWGIAWSKASKDLRQQFLDLPNFDAEIFKEITGIEVKQPNTCEGRIIEVDGKKYKLQEV